MLRNTARVQISGRTVSTDRNLSHIYSGLKRQMDDQRSQRSVVKIGWFTGCAVMKTAETSELSHLNSP